MSLCSKTQKIQLVSNGQMLPVQEQHQRTGYRLNFHGVKIGFKLQVNEPFKFIIRKNWWALNYSNEISTEVAYTEYILILSAAISLMASNFSHNIIRIYIERNLVKVILQEPNWRWPLNIQAFFMLKLTRKLINLLFVGTLVLFNHSAKWNLKASYILCCAKWCSPLTSRLVGPKTNKFKFFSASLVRLVH